MCWYNRLILNAFKQNMVVMHLSLFIIPICIFYTGKKVSLSNCTISHIGRHSKRPNFRGTERFSVLDWYTDLSTEPFLAHALGYNYRTPRVHTGFYRQYRGLQASIYEYIARYNPTTIFNVGHSLGGALATIGSLDLSMRLSAEVNQNPVQVYNITVSN